MTPVSTRRGVLLGALGLTGLSPMHSGRAAPQARTSRGLVEGTSQNGVQVFKGIPYGSDTKTRRFLAPQPPKRWTGVRKAIVFGPASPQTSNEPNQSEDCLYLNIWTPALHDGGNRAVMVYIHGGAYSNGSGSAAVSDGTNLAKRGDVVVVTVNHRLNAFGYLSLGLIDEHFADSGNAGQLDLVLALQWIQENIAAFGGDPAHVMVFGQSGGGAKIATLMAMPSARGLFHRAATMSGQQLTASGPLHARERAELFLKTLGISTANLDDLKTVATEKLVAALATTDPIIGSGGLYFGPVLDIKNLERHPFYPDAPAQSATIPMMIGNTHDETRAFITDPGIYTLSWDQLPARLEKNMRVDIAPKTVIESYKAWFPGISPTDLFFLATTAARSWRAAIVEAEQRAAAGTPAFVYQLDFPCPDDHRRAMHTTDIPLAFDNTDKDGAVTGNGERARTMAAVMSETFIAFAKTGRPDNRLIPAWTPYSLERRETMVFDLPPHIENDPRGPERKLFEKVPFIQQGT